MYGYKRKSGQKGCSAKRGQQHFPGLMEASAPRSQILTRDVHFFIPWSFPALSYLCVGDSAFSPFLSTHSQYCSHGFNYPYATVPKSVSYPAFLLRPEMSCLLVISLGAQRLDKGKTKFSSFLHPVSTSFFGILQVDRSHCHPKKQSGNHSWYLLFSDQSYSGLWLPWESTFFLFIPLLLPCSCHSLGTSYSPQHPCSSFLPGLLISVIVLSPLFSHPPIHTASSVIFLKCKSHLVRVR